jgi:hypothetical protein
MYSLLGSIFGSFGDEKELSDYEIAKDPVFNFFDFKREIGFGLNPILTNITGFVGDCGSVFGAGAKSQNIPAF